MWRANVRPKDVQVQTPDCWSLRARMDSIYSIISPADIFACHPRESFLDRWMCRIAGFPAPGLCSFCALKAPDWFLGSEKFPKPKNQSGYTGKGALLYRSIMRSACILAASYTLAASYNPGNNYNKAESRRLFLMALKKSYLTGNEIRSEVRRHPFRNVRSESQLSTASTRLTANSFQLKYIGKSKSSHCFKTTRIHIPDTGLRTPRESILSHLMIGFIGGTTKSRRYKMVMDVDYGQYQLSRFSSRFG